MRNTLNLLIFIVLLFCSCDKSSSIINKFTFNISLNDDVYESCDVRIIDSEFSNSINIFIDLTGISGFNSKIEFNNINLSEIESNLNDDWRNPMIGESFALLYGFIDEDVIGQRYTIQDEISRIEKVSTVDNSQIIYKFDRLLFRKDTITNDNLLFSDSIIILNGKIEFSRDF